jgi:hypothetical protein
LKDVCKYVGLSRPADLHILCRSFEEDIVSDRRAVKIRDPQPQRATGAGEICIAMLVARVHGQFGIDDGEGVSAVAGPGYRINIFPGSDVARRLCVFQS